VTATRARPEFALVLAAWLLLGLVPPVPRANAQSAAPPGSNDAPPPGAAGYATHAELDPGYVHLGERAMYRAWVLVPRGESVRWQPPVSDGALHWGAPAARRTPAAARATPNAEAARDTVRIEIPLQIFALGSVSVPGIRAWLPYVPPLNVPSMQSLPVVHAVVIPVVPAGDTSADLKPLRGPVGAPWWELVPWKIVFAAWALVAAVIALIWWLRRRKPVIKAVAAPPPPRRRHPSEEALAELQALRRMLLPEHDRYSEHAMHLTRILKRYLEATTGLARPGDTTPEWVERMKAAAAARAAAADGAPEVVKLEGYLRLWDRIKFARAASTIEEAQAAERAVEEWVRHPAAEPAKDVA
jgi:Domain of unknown function (DUF4381)